MTDPRIVERAKKLSIHPVGDSLLRFRATLDDSYHSDEGDEGDEGAEGAEGDEIIHSIALEGTISVPDLVIRSITPISHKQPYPECAASLDPVRGLAGVRIGPGFRSKVMELMGRTKGCSHFLSLALDVAASHTLIVFMRMRERGSYEERDTPDGRWLKIGFAIEPHLENACIALRSDSRVVVTAKRTADQ